MARSVRATTRVPALSPRDTGHAGSRMVKDGQPKRIAEQPKREKTQVPREGGKYGTVKD